VKDMPIDRDGRRGSAVFNRRKKKHTAKLRMWNPSKNLGEKGREKWQKRQSKKSV
jgi:hypothetical protein